VALTDLRGREEEPAVRSLVDAEPGWMLVGWESAGELVACAGLEREGDELVVRAIAAKEGHDVAAALMDAIDAVATAERFVAVGDENADVLRRCGFAVESTHDGESRWTRPIAPRPVPPGATAALTLDEVSDAIRSAWSRETSDDPDEWSAENPARGQCAVTALLVRDLLGGEILIANVVRDGRRVDRHAWNRLPSGLDLDLTRSQFRAGEQFEQPAVGEPTLTDPARVELFAARVREKLGL
jgi:hypothetical protein